MISRRDPEAGVVLVNVLVILALAAGLVVLMLDAQDRALDRGRLAGNFAQAEALARGAEASVAVALRRDMIEAPESDHLAEPWAASTQEGVELETGRFSVEVTDANARFDLNRLTGRTLIDAQILGRIAAVGGLSDDVAPRIAAGLAQAGPIAEIDALSNFGLTDAEIAALEPFVTALPVPGALNLNTAGGTVLAAVLNNRPAAMRLIRQRETAGFLTEADLARVGVIRPPNSGFTSDIWDVTAEAEVDGATARTRSRLLRRRSPGKVEVVAVSRRPGVMTAAPLPPPFIWN